MEDKMMAFKAMITALLSALMAFLGWKGVLAVVWVALMVLDYVSGTAAACMRGQWSSKVAREGLFHKGGMILVVFMALLADIGLGSVAEHMDFGFVWPSLVLPLVLVWYIITEIGSILENAAAMGAKVPVWLIKLMKVSLQLVDKLGDKTDENNPSEDAQALEEAEDT